jgi:hypothetical protein
MRPELRIPSQPTVRRAEAPEVLARNRHAGLPLARDPNLPSLAQAVSVDS